MHPFPHTHLSRLVLEAFTFFERHAPNLNNLAEKFGALGLTFGI